MRIKKIFQGSIPENKILNEESTSQTDTYSCAKINEMTEEIFNMIGTKETNGYCKLPNGLVLCWGSEDASTFEQITQNGGYKKTITLPYEYTEFIFPIVCSQYTSGFSNSNVHSYSLSQLSLGCAVNFANYKVNWLTIGV